MNLKAAFKSGVSESTSQSSFIVQNERFIFCSCLVNQHDSIAKFGISVVASTTLAGHFVVDT